jgi:hypothetical protein
MNSRQDIAHRVMCVSVIEIVCGCYPIEPVGPIGGRRRGQHNGIGSKYR